ncbi:hypothetical protein PAMA_013130 [Pampus argenteus]
MAAGATSPTQRLGLSRLTSSHHGDEGCLVRELPGESDDNEITAFTLENLIIIENRVCGVCSTKPSELTLFCQSGSCEMFEHSVVPLMNPSAVHSLRLTSL